MKKGVLLLLILSINIIVAQEKIEILNTSINSKFAELGVIYLKNNAVLFASSKKSDTDKSFSKDRRKNNRQLFLDLYRGVVKDNGDIRQTNKFSKELNNKYFESDLSFTSDFKTLYFTWNNFYNTNSRKDSAKWRTLHIFKASINLFFELSNITPATFNSKHYSVRSPSISRDGKKLYFISDMDKGYGNTDIYVVDVFENGTFSEPENLGPNINSKNPELFPFVDENNTLYYSTSNSAGKNRSLDIYKSEFIDGEFQKPTKLPAPINSEFDDFAYVIDNATKSGYFTSNRKGGKGDVDIYNFKIQEHEIICNQSITGLVFNKKTNEPLNNVSVAIFEDTELLDSKIIKNNDAYNFKLDCEKNYIITASKEGFEESKLYISSTNVPDFKITQPIMLTPLECNQYIAGTVLDLETKLPINKASITIFEDDNLIESTLSDSEGKFNYKLNCDTSYKFIVTKFDYKQDSQIIFTSKKRNEQLNKTFLLKSDVEFVTVRKQKMIKTNPIYFDLDKNNIRPDAAIELNKVVDILVKYPTIKLEVNSHTDSRAPDKYNMNLSNKRALSTISYIVSKGINASRIEGKGYGETQLINRCSNGVKCTNAEHQLNRRTEFIVIDE